MLTAGHQAELHRYAIECPYLHPYTVEVAAHGYVLTSEDFSLQEFAAANADVITRSYRKRVQPVVGCCQVLRKAWYNDF
jgi:hypothetical protein